MLRSRDHILNQLKLRKAMDDHSAQEAAEPDDWDHYTRIRNHQTLTRLRAELTALSESDLDLAFNGQGVHGSAMTMRRLNALSFPLRRSLYWTGRDIMALDGEPATEGPATELAEPMVKGMFDGSFGLRVGRIPVSEQLPLGGETLFERAVGRFVNVFQASAESGSADDILGHVIGLRQYTITALTDLARQIADSEAPTYIRWKGNTVLTISPTAAFRLAETLSTVTDREENQRIMGILQGGDLASEHERFHIVPQSRSGDDPEHYRGTIAPAAIPSMHELSLGSAVVATVRVIFTESPLLPMPTAAYVLLEIEARPTAQPETPSEPERPA